MFNKMSSIVYSRLQLSALCFGLALVGMGMNKGYADSITLSNADFQSSDADVPTGWTRSTFDPLGIYVWDDAKTPTGEAVLAIQARTDRWIQQSFSTSEATADSYPEYSISFDSGWRSNTSSPNDLSLVFSIYNMDNATVLGSQTYTFPANQPDNLFDTYQVINTGNTVSVKYDNTDPALTGKVIGLRITTETTQNSYNPTGWIDNISVNAIPEPSTMGILLLAGIAGIVRFIIRARM